MTERMTWRPGRTPLQRGLLLGLAVASVLATTPIVGPGAGVLVLVGAGLAWWLVPRFWSGVLYGAIGGVVSGLLILGPGLRLAMRVVALIDPLRSPEFTMEGTMFIVIFVGGFFGSIFGIAGNLARRGLELRSIMASAIVPAVAVLAVLLTTEELRMELFDLGAGARMNIPMFGMVSLLYGVGAMATAMRLQERRASKPPAGEDVSTLASNTDGARR
ncbi:MAG TPA: hypothetical protein VM848_17730 [Acidimicrobiia bacterium]|nr:hypothetical protein [Acidimicrobiia bacterium]